VGKYAAFFVLELRQWTEFKIDFYFFWLESTFKALVMGLLWWQIWETSGGQFGEVDRDVFFSLLIFTQVLQLPFRGSETISQMMEVPVVSGKMALVLCRPVHPLWMNLSRVVCRQGRLLLFCLGMLFLANAFILPRLGIEPQGHTLLEAKVWIALLQGMLINYFLYSMLGVISFWVGDVWSLLYVIGIFAGFFSGQFFPLHLQSDLEMVSRWLPFRYIAYSAGSIAAGLEGWGEIARQSFVMLCLGTGTFKLYAVGVRKFEASGG
jgi:ABC-type uncharacterized transport system permease subunit